jgi:hypothetical protein
MVPAAVMLVCAQKPTNDVTAALEPLSWGGIWTAVRVNAGQFELNTFFFV